MKFVLVLLSMCSLVFGGNNTNNATELPTRSSNVSDWQCFKSSVRDEYTSARLINDNHTLECMRNGTTNDCFWTKNTSMCTSSPNATYNCTSSPDVQKWCVNMFGDMILGPELTLKNFMQYFYYVGQNWWARVGLASALIVVGLLFALSGYFLLRLLIVLLGGVFFALVFYELAAWLAGSASWVWVVYCIMAILFGLWCVSWFFLAIFVKGAVTGVTAALQALEIVSPDPSTLYYIIVVVTGIVGGVAALKKERVTMITFTSYFGATCVTYGIYFLFNIFFNLNKTIFDASMIELSWAFIFCIAGTFVGALVQFKYTAAGVYHHYDNEMMAEIALEQMEKEENANKEARNAGEFADEELEGTQQVTSYVKELSGFERWLSWL